MSGEQRTGALGEILSTSLCGKYFELKNQGIIEVFGLELPNHLEPDYFPKTTEASIRAYQIDPLTGKRVSEKAIDTLRIPFRPERLYEDFKPVSEETLERILKAERERREEASTWSIDPSYECCLSHD